MSDVRKISWLVIGVAMLAGCPSSTTEPGGGDVGLDAHVFDSSCRSDGCNGFPDTGGAPDAASGSETGVMDVGVAPDTGSIADTGTDAPSPVDSGTDAASTHDAGACTPPCGIGAHACCNGTCVYTYNDPMNCGSCGHRCAASEYCAGGSCVPRPCTATCGSGVCCGSMCCNAGQICCDPSGPVGTGPTCTTPMNGTCAPGCAPLCVCASPDTMIATPSGERPIADLVIGDLVYSASGGALVAVPLAEVHRTWVGGDHRIVRVVLETGRVLEISPGHPTADGRFFSDLRAGELLDGTRVVSAELVAYAHDYTYDVLPASDTATYVAGGVLIGSTLAPAGAPIALGADAAE